MTVDKSSENDSGLSTQPSIRQRKAVLGEKLFVDSGIDTQTVLSVTSDAYLNTASWKRTFDNDDKKSQGHPTKTSKISAYSATTGLAVVVWVLIAWIVLVSIGLYTQNMLPSPRALSTSHDITDIRGSFGEKEAHAYAGLADPAFSEFAAREIVRELASEIGFRVVGTHGERLARQLILSRARLYKSAAEQYASSLESRPSDNKKPGLATLHRPRIDIDVQTVSGSHIFDFMGEPVIKVYQNISNVVVVVSCSDNMDDECNRNAILINSHYDSTIVSPGATDDGVGVAVMLEVMRVVAHASQQRKLRNTMILLFNGAEETLQDASHGFITQHPMAKSIRAVLNLEAMGTRDKEILFQANSDAVLQAYRSCPHPHATVLASDIMKTGIIMSDTDFRQFVQYGNVTGIDMAYFVGSYHYHTTLDVESNIQMGSIQHFGDNMLAMVQYLLFEADLSSENDKASLSSMSNQNAVFYDYLGIIFLHYSWWTAMVLHLGTSAMLIAVVGTWLEPLGMTWSDAIVEGLHVGVSLVKGVVAAVVVSVTIAYGFGNVMSWFSREWYSLVLFSGPILLGYLDRAFRIRIKTNDGLYRDRSAVDERRMLVGMAVFWTAMSTVLTVARIGSSYLCVMHAGSILVGFVADMVMNRYINIDVFVKDKDDSEKKMTKRWIMNGFSIVGYAAMLLATPYGAVTGYNLLLLFVPLLGRAGIDAPVDEMIAVVTAISMFSGQMYVLSGLVQRIGQKAARFVWFGLMVWTVFSMFLFSFVSPYDFMHPKRVLLAVKKDGKSGSEKVLVGELDRGRAGDLVRAVEKQFGSAAVPRSRSETEADWSTIYPVSRFMSNYELEIAGSDKTRPDKSADRKQISIRTTSVYDAATNETVVDVEVDHVGYVWTVVRLVGEVVWWDIADGVVPLSGSGQHVHTVRHVAGVGGSEKWRMRVGLAGSSAASVSVSGLDGSRFGAVEADGGEFVQRVAAARPSWTDGPIFVVADAHSTHP